MDGSGERSRGLERGEENKGIKGGEERVRKVVRWERASGRNRNMRGVSEVPIRGSVSGCV